jgi:pyruvate formate lyase activating enzyme
MRESLPLIVDIKTGSTEDGPGIRSTVFFKGCPLRCRWCHNPETMDAGLEIGFFPGRCIGCFDCDEACPEGAIIKSEDERIDRSRCTRCGKCADACPAEAIRRIGKYYETDELLERLLRDRVFYEVSGGGVTLSGGEPTLWPEYAGTLLRRLKQEGIHTALQTCGYFDYSTFEEKMLPWLDLVMYDLKLMSAEDHRGGTGRDNRGILENFIRLLSGPAEILPRIPLIPGFTASEGNLEGISSFLKGNGVRRCSLLPYNPLGLSKWDNMGKNRPDLPATWMDRHQMERCRRIFERLHLPPEEGPIRSTGLTQRPLTESAMARFMSAKS